MYKRQNLELQNIATSSLRKGLEIYDRRKGWRGSLTNKANSKNWKKDLNIDLVFHLTFGILKLQKKIEKILGTVVIQAVL